jgi:hypothetical protein
MPASDLSQRDSVVTFQFKVADLHALTKNAASKRANGRSGRNGRNGDTA